MRRSINASAFATFFCLAPLAVVTGLSGCSGSSSGSTTSKEGHASGDIGDDSSTSTGDNASGSSGKTASGSTSGGSTDDGTGDDSGSGTTSGDSDAGAKADAAPAKPATPVADGEVWADGKQITSSLIIPPGSTASIADGAQITIAAGASITVAGTLKGSSTAAHAKLTGTGWPGVVVQAGGTLTLDGVDVVNAATGIQTSAGNGSATLTNGIISGSTTPFNVGVGSSLKLDHSNVTGSKGPSTVDGSFTASYMDYDSNGYYGIYVTDASATLSVEDSKLHAQTRTTDMFEVSKVANFHVAHTTVSAAHCAFHFTGPTNFDVSYVDVYNVSFGFMMWGSNTTTGTRTVTTSNFTKLVETITGAAGGTGISEQAKNGPISVTGSYFDSTAPIQLIDSEITVTKVTQPVTGVGPR